MKKPVIYLFLVAGFTVHCSGDLPLSDLVNNTVTLKVMGTYESNDPYPLQHAGVANALPLDDVINAGISGSNPTIAAGSDLYNYITSGAADSRDPNGVFPQWQAHADKIRYYIDIAEIRLAEGQGKSSSQSISDYWSQFAITRQLMCSDYGTTDPNRILTNCQGSSGVDRLAQFFAGGFNYPAVDVATGNYNHMGIYFRRFATYPAASFTGQGQYIPSTADNNTWGTDGVRTRSEGIATATFDNRTIYGADIEGFLQNPYGATAAEPLMFPLQRKDLSLRITNGAEPYVLEVRIFLQNLMMIHVRQVSNDINTSNASDPAKINLASNNASVYVAPADWNIDHKFLETDGSGNSAKQGGSVLMTARVYQPKYVGSIKIKNSAATQGDYFAVVSAGTTFPGQVWAVDANTPSTTILPLAATRAYTSGTTNHTITNLPPGNYNLYRTCDIKKCLKTSTAGYCDQLGGNKITPQTDGFPETSDTCGSWTVTAGTETSVDFATSCPAVNCP